MRHLFFGFVRLLLVGTSTIGLSTIANYYNHKGYWDGTISRVQTTDFNILSHTLPTKLSLALIRGDQAEIQRTLNSNYGLFGIVVTDCTSVEPNCSGQRIVYATESDLPWRQQLSAQRLYGLPHNYLQNPPPLISEGGYDTSRSTTWNANSVRNPGMIIGRVYYIRGIPPQFWAAYTTWFNQMPGSLLSNSGAQRYYALTLGFFSLAGFSVWRFIERLYLRKRQQKRLFDKEKKLIQEEKNQVQREADLLQQKLQDQQNQLSQMTFLIEERQKFITQLEQYEKAQKQQTQQLKQIVIHYEAQLQKQQLISQSHLDHQEKALNQIIRNRPRNLTKV